MQHFVYLWLQHLGCASLLMNDAVSEFISCNLTLESFSKKQLLLKRKHYLVFLTKHFHEDYE